MSSKFVYGLTIFSTSFDILLEKTTFQHGGEMQSNAHKLRFMNLSYKIESILRTMCYLTLLPGAKRPGLSSGYIIIYDLVYF